MLVWLILLLQVILVTATPATTPHPPAFGDQSESSTITLTSDGWILPLTALANDTDCSYFFTVPEGYFAYTQMKAINLQQGEQFYIADEGDGFVKTDDINDDRFHSFSDVETWPGDFNVHFNTSSESLAQYSLNISLFKATPTASIVKSYVTYPGCSSAFLDTSSWNEGDSYKFRSKGGSVFILTANLPDNDRAKWSNVYIYEQGELKGTLGSVATDGIGYVSETSEVLLYMPKKINISASAIITDYSNVKDLKYRAQYLPNTPESTTVTYYGFYKASLTLVSSRRAPRNVTILSFTNTSGNGILSYNGGGPDENHTKAVNITSDQLPFTVSGYANTFYLPFGNNHIIGIVYQ